jgi:hypothetical protein
MLPTPLKERLKIYFERLGKDSLPNAQSAGVQPTYNGWALLCDSLNGFQAVLQSAFWVASPNAHSSPAGNQPHTVQQQAAETDCRIHTL